MCWIFWAGKITNTTHLKITLNMFNSELRAFWNLDLNFPGYSGTSGSSLTTLSAKNPWNFKADEVLRERQHSQRVWHSTLMYRIPGCWQLKTKALFNLHLDGTWYLLTSVSDWMKTQKPLSSLLIRAYLILWFLMFKLILFMTSKDLQGDAVFPPPSRRGWIPTCVCELQKVV